MFTAAKRGAAGGWGGDENYTTEHPKPPSLDNDNEARPQVSPFSVCVRLPPTTLHVLFLLHSPTVFDERTHTHTQRERERGNIFISSLYAGCAQPEIAALTPRCEPSRGNVYPNPTEHAINLFFQIEDKQECPSVRAIKTGNTYPGPSRQSSHCEARGGSNEPGAPPLRHLPSPPCCLPGLLSPQRAPDVPNIH